jgi:excisionase family DNA binding protein
MEKQKVDRLLPVSVVAKRLSVCTQTIYNAIIFGKLRAVRVGPKCGIRVFESDLDEYLKGRKYTVLDDPYLQEKSQSS